MPEGESGKDYLERLAQKECDPFPYPWSYAFRREFLCKNNLFYREDLCGPEDFELNMRAIPLAESVVGTDALLYLRRVRQESESSISLQLLKNVLPVLVEVYRRRPASATATAFASYISEIGRFPRCDVKDLIAYVEDNLDLLDNVSSSYTKLLKPLVRLFGLYNGSKIYSILKDVKNKNIITRNIHWPSRRK